MNKILLNLKSDIENSKNETKQSSNERFFKTQKGEYGEGDIFLGINVPTCKAISKKYFKELSTKDTENLLKSKFHEERLIALFILIEKYKRLNTLKEKEEIFNIYFKNIKHINNWDLVDTSAYKIVGDFLKQKYSLKTKNCSGVKFLLSLASDKHIYSNPKSKNNLEKLWEKRISIISAFAFMKSPVKTEYSPEIIFEITKKILSERDQINKHDLIDKALGWMLREYGKRISKENLNSFLDQNFNKIKSRRTLLRYAIEKFNKEEREYWLRR